MLKLAYISVEKENGKDAVKDGASTEEEKKESKEGTKKKPVASRPISGTSMCELVQNLVLCIMLFL